MRRQALDDKVIKEVLRLIDTKKYTQAELALRFGVTQGTISNYNRIFRMRFRIRENAKLIAKLNMEILELKEKMNMDTTEETSVPDSFKFIKLVLENKRLSRKTDVTGLLNLDGYFTTERDDAIQYTYRHPEYHMYTLIAKKGAEPDEFRSNGHVNVFGIYLGREDFGFIDSLHPEKIMEYNLYDFEVDEKVV